MPGDAIQNGPMQMLAVQAATMRAAAASSTAATRLDVNARARAQAVDFESMFLTSMFSQMFTGVDGEGPFGGSGATGVWRSFLTDQYARSFARAGGIGIADHVYRALLQQQEAQPAAPSRQGQ
jgi:Rod binding domain-containing protein